jgi:hypothetical protein
MPTSPLYSRVLTFHNQCYTEGWKWFKPLCENFRLDVVSSLPFILQHLCCLFGCIQVQIQHKKVDLSKVTSKCGSKDNIKHKPGSHLMILEIKTASQMPPYSLHSTLLLATFGYFSLHSTLLLSCSKRVDYIGNRVPFGKRPLSN